jgi:hypothetical protein
MTIAVLLRLISGPQAQGRVVGHAEIVDTGERQAFKDEAEMLAILERVSNPSAAFTADPATQPEAD